MKLLVKESSLKRNNRHDLPTPGVSREAPRSVSHSAIGNRSLAPRSRRRTAIPNQQELDQDVVVMPLRHPPSRAAVDELYYFAQLVVLRECDTDS